MRGGVDRAFVSTSHDRDEAMRYATTGDDGVPMLFEMQMGMVDRGADIEWLSQYPREKECLFAPLTAFELLRTRVDEGVLVAEIRLNANMNALTLEEVIDKMKRSQLQLIKAVRSDLARSGKPTNTRLDWLEAELRSRQGTWFNDPKNYKDSIARIFKARDVSPSRSAATRARAVPVQSRRAYVKAVERGFKSQSASQGMLERDEWTAEAWLRSSPRVIDVLARTLLAAARAVVPPAMAADELATMRYLADVDAATLTTMLSSCNEEMGGILADELQRLREEHTVREMRSKHSKFAADCNAYTLKYTELGSFYDGLEGLIGPPDPEILTAMNGDHTKAADSYNEFCTHNYGIHTKPHTEWFFVAEPAKCTHWPEERRGIDCHSKRRKPMSQAEFVAALSKRNAMLTKLEEPLLMREEAFGARLYTGPMCALPSSVRGGNSRAPHFSPN